MVFEAVLLLIIIIINTFQICLQAFFQLDWNSWGNLD